MYMETMELSQFNKTGLHQVRGKYRHKLTKLGQFNKTGLHGNYRPTVKSI